MTLGLAEELWYATSTADLECIIAVLHQTDALESVAPLVPELNRAHTRDVIHYEPDHDGIMPGRDWPEYEPRQGQIPSVKSKTSTCAKRDFDRSRKVMNSEEQSDTQSSTNYIPVKYEVDQSL